MLNKLKRDAAATSSAEPQSKRARKDMVESGALRNAGGAAAIASSYPTVPVKSVYLACPPKVQTGGPEAMHQLCSAINKSDKFQGKARMLYLREDSNVGVRHSKGVGRVAAYERYDASAADGLPDNETELIIWPEVWTQHIDSKGLVPSGKIRPAHQTAIWWLSVDNNNGKFKDWKRDDILHLYQSEYAKQHLVKNGAKHIIAMTEYIPNRAVPAASERTLQVLYNPVKGIHYTDEIKRRSGKGKHAISFTPIGGGSGGRTRISPEEVVAMLGRARVYIDFGPHPGMDRLPREAAIASCIVITNGDGAAQFDTDVPIPPHYKVRKFDVDRIHRLLRRSLDEYEKRVKDFDDYRKWIGGQMERMDMCVDKFLDEVAGSRLKVSKP